jgi:hypothetical protein
MAAQFIFGGNTGIASAKDLERQRMLIEALQGPRPAPKNLGEGLSALGEAIGYRMASKRLAGQEKEAASAGQALFDSLLGGAAGQPVPEPTPATFADRFANAMPGGQPYPGADGITAADQGGVFDAEAASSPAQAQPIPEQSPIQSMDLRQLLQLRRDQRWQYLDDGQRQFIEGQIDSEFKRRYRQNDPEYNMGLEKLRLEIEDMRNPKLSPAEQANVDLQNARLGLDREEFALKKATAGTPQSRPATAEEKASYGVAPDAPLVIGEGGKPSLLGDGQVNVTVGGEIPDGELRKNLQKKEGESWAAIKDQAVISSGMAQDMQVIDELIGMAPQGPIQGRLAESFPGFSSAASAFESVVKRVAPTLRTPGSGATSDIEYDGMLKSLPALRNKPAANRLISTVMKSKAAINMERGAIVDAYANGEIAAADARKQMTALDKKSIMTPETKLLILGLNNNSKDALTKKYGLEK